VGPSAAALRRFAQGARGVFESQPPLTHPSDAFSPSQSVLYPSAVAAAAPGKLLMALDSHLEPDTGRHVHEVRCVWRWVG
jgi:hypothetical protein